jgi:thiosulfate dehydrogenase [quinone] large subunit
MKRPMIQNPYSQTQLAGLLILRILIGWHLLYEGFVKLVNPYWSSTEYLLGSQGIFSGFFNALARRPVLVEIVDQLNIWGLILIGSALIAGCFFRTACITGMGLIAFYYISNPPFIGLSSPIPTEGSYLFVNKNLVEIAALFVLYLFPTGRLLGLDRFFHPISRRNPNE